MSEVQKELVAVWAAEYFGCVEKNRKRAEGIGDKL